MSQNSHDIIIALRLLLETGLAGTQDEIRLALEQQGYTLSQSKVSRLLTKISAIKVADAKGRSIYRLPSDHGLAREYLQNSTQTSINQLVIGVTASDTLIVVHTNPGAAQLIARIIDQEKQTLDILGCIAGDDTIFVAPQSSRVIPSVLLKLQKLFYQ